MLKWIKQKLNKLLCVHYFEPNHQDINLKAAFNAQYGKKSWRCAICDKVVYSIDLPL